MSSRCDRDATRKLSQDDLHNDNIRWQPISASKISQGPTPRWRARDSQWQLKEGESVCCTGYFHSPRLPPRHWLSSSSNASTWKQQWIDSLDSECVWCVYVWVCVTVILIEQEIMNLRGSWRDMIGVGREKGRRDVSTVLMYEILKNLFY